MRFWEVQTFDILQRIEDFEKVFFFACRHGNIGAIGHLEVRVGFAEEFDMPQIDKVGMMNAEKEVWREQFLVFFQRFGDDNGTVVIEKKRGVGSFGKTANNVGNINKVDVFLVAEGNFFIGTVELLEAFVQECNLLCKRGLKRIVGESLETGFALNICHSPLYGSAQQVFVNGLEDKIYRAELKSMDSVVVMRRDKYNLKIWLGKPPQKVEARSVLHFYIQQDQCGIVLPDCRQAAFYAVCLVDFQRRFQRRQAYGKNFCEQKSRRIADGLLVVNDKNGHTSEVLVEGAQQ